MKETHYGEIKVDIKRLLEDLNDNGIWVDEECGRRWPNFDANDDARTHH